MKKNKNGGYIALMTSIFISIILFLIMTKQNTLGWETSFNILSVESKSKSEILAENCIKVIVFQILNGTYKENTSVYKYGTCKNFPITNDFPSVGFTKINTQAVVNNAYTNIEAILDKNQNMKVTSYNEIAKI